ncbi:hypothetical protein MLD52_23035 [Puniceicoccaceae bacterium K14]|nr:hypothetical protein [Puniceicoccaceae bacterium K14]
MNAAEIIEEIRGLPHEEKGKVVQFVRELSEEETEIAAAIEESLADIDAGRVYSSAEVREQLKSWYGK